MTAASAGSVHSHACVSVEVLVQAVVSVVVVAMGKFRWSGKIDVLQVEHVVSGEVGPEAVADPRV